jgi:type III pantothenate kinase
MEVLLNKLSGKIKRLFLSSVKTTTKAQLNILEKTGVRPLFLNANLKMPFINKYETPNTLGADRLALVAGGLFIYPNKPILIIDVGTCLTFDFVSEKGVYYGGSISPGLQMRLNALHTLTGKLPLVSLGEPKDLIGKSTKESMLSGVVNGIQIEIDGIIDWYKLRYPQVKTILTGGDSAFFDKKLKNSIFADADILLKGMHFILEHNTHEKN